MTPRRARTVGALALALTATGLLAWGCVPARVATDRLALSVHTEQVGAGVRAGTEVRLDGVLVGAVTDLTADDTGRQRLDLDLDQAQLSGLTDTFALAYAPANLFGISDIELRARQGGAPLRDGAVVDLTGPHADRVVDATLSVLLRSLGAFTTEALTPDLAAVVNRIARETRAFTPLLETMVAMSRAVADTRQLPAPFLLREYGAALQGFPSTLDGIIRMLYGPYQNAYLQSPENQRKTSATVDMIVTGLMPGAGRAAGAAQEHFEGLSTEFAPLLDALAATVPTPQRSAQDLATLLARISRGLTGPALNLDLELDLSPGQGGAR